MEEKFRVLSIDDEADFCYFVKKNLMQTGLFDVSVADNGTDGVKLAIKEQPDIILLDLFMTDMSGEDVAAALQETITTKNIPIIYITALASSEDVGQGENYIVGNNYILPKPVRTKRLVETIMKILSRRDFQSGAEQNTNYLM